MPEDVRVRRVRISHLATRIHDRLQVIGGPVAFAQRLTSLQPVQGLQIALPFGESLPVETGFWQRVAERSLTAPVPLAEAHKLRRAGVPLRYRGMLQVHAEVPRLEIHLHPFGVVAMTTVDLSWSAPVTLQQVWQAAHDVESQQAVVTVGGREINTALREAAAQAAHTVVELLTQEGLGEAWNLPPYRLVSVISGMVDPPPVVMPAANSPLHLALHQLSSDNAVMAVAPPSAAFVAQWNGAGYSWPVNNLIYMLESGAAMLSTEATEQGSAGELRTADRHRWLLLLLAYVNALSGLVYATRYSKSVLFPGLAKTAAQRLGQLFGPGRIYLDWGLVPRALMELTDASNDVQYVLGAPLEAKPNYQPPEYG